MFQSSWAEIGNRANMSFRFVSALVAAALTTTACGAPEEASSLGGSSAGDGQGSAVLKDLSGEQMCGLLSEASIAQYLDATVDRSEGQERGRAPKMQSPYFLTRQCEYEMADGPDLTTEVTTEWDEATSDEEVLDGVFTDSTGESDSDSRYERLPGLGDLAGFGEDRMLSDAGLAGSDLGVVFHLNGERLLLTVGTLGNVEKAQLQPLAEELLDSIKEAV